MGRKLSFVVFAVAVGLVMAGVTSAIAASSIVVEETIVVHEHTVRSRLVDLVGKPDDFKPGDRYLFRSELSDETGVVGSLSVECSVGFARVDDCTQTDDLARGTIVAAGQVPVAELSPGGTWTLAILGGTEEFENVRGSVTVVLLESGDSEQTLHLIP